MTKVRPLAELRFVTRDGKLILQQRFELADYYTNTYGDPDVDYTFEWRDVPTLSADPGRYA